MNLNDILNIKVKIADRGAIEKITPEMITEYLEFHGWKKKKEVPWLKPGQAYIWRHSEKRKEMLAAHDTALSDYIIRTSELIKELSEVENRSELSIWYEMVTWDARMVEQRRADDVYTDTYESDEE